MAACIKQSSSTMDIPALRAAMRRAGRCLQCGREASRQKQEHKSCDGCGTPASPIRGQLFGEVVTDYVWETVPEIAALVRENPYVFHSLVKKRYTPEEELVLKNVLDKYPLPLMYGYHVVRPQFIPIYICGEEAPELVRVR